jgi:hypothetical protein
MRKRPRKTNLPFKSIEGVIQARHLPLVLRFFLVFSRFEYALKRAGFTNPKRRAEAAWDRFATENDARFGASSTSKLQAACVYFLQHPPLRQIQKNGVLDWEVPNQLINEPLLKRLLLMVRSVRNNMFHGGKFPMMPVDEPARNVTLLRHALVILETSVKLDGEVERLFFTFDID